jgi:hypothetical protein
MQMSSAPVTFDAMANELNYTPAAYGIRGQNELRNSLDPLTAVSVGVTWCIPHEELKRTSTEIIPHFAFLAES